MMKKNLRIVMMACLMILSGTAVAQKTILMPQQAFENLTAGSPPTTMSLLRRRNNTAGGMSFPTIMLSPSGKLSR